MIDTSVVKDQLRFDAFVVMAAELFAQAGAWTVSIFRNQNETSRCHSTQRVLHKGYLSAQMFKNSTLAHERHGTNSPIQNANWPIQNAHLPI